MVRLGTLATVAFCTAASVGASAGIRAHAATMFSGTVVTCDDTVGVSRLLPNPYRAMGLSFGIHDGAEVEGRDQGDGLLWVKAGVLLLPSRSVTLRMVSPSPGLGGMRWSIGDGPTTGTVRFDRCSNDAGVTPLAKGVGYGYAGGFYVRGATCVRIAISQGARHGSLTFRIRARGAPAPRCT